MAKLLPSIHYPAVMAAAFSLFAVLQATGMPLVVSTYVPVLFVAAVGRRDREQYTAKFWELTGRKRDLATATSI